tara:strand:+ start:1412 stop:2989 length:1578 start_codon:yes stop_codon:yes gene_type:complete
MTRSVQSKLFSKENRLKKINTSKIKGDPTYLQIANGMMLGYRRTKTANGKWHGKIRGKLIGLDQQDYHKFLIGVADDYCEADGEKVFNLQQAQEQLHKEKARYVEEGKKKKIKLSVTFAEAARMYHEDYTDRKARPNSTHKHYLDRMIATQVPLRLKNPKVYKDATLGNIRIDDITLQDLESIKSNVAKTARQNDYKLVKITEVEKARRRKVTANRVVVILKAILNFAYTHKQVTHVKTNAQWLPFKKFKGVDSNRKDWWDYDECQAWLNKCNEPSLRNFFIGAISCGFRFGEQSMLRVGDVELDASTKYVHVRAEITKTARDRKVIIPSQYVEYFQTLIAGRDKDELLYIYRGGKRNSDNFTSHKVYQAFQLVTKAAKIRRLTWHSLRHSYASQLVNAGVPLKVVADQLGHTTTIYVEKWYAHLKSEVIQEAVDRLPKMNNLIQDEAAVVKLKQAKRYANLAPKIYDDTAREAVWVVPEDAEEKIAAQNSEHFQTVNKARKRGETKQGYTWKYLRKKEAANEKA